MSSSFNSYFSGTPFALTASRENAACWSGRQDVRKRLERIRRSYLSRPDSTLDLVWANLGAGKSHALYHLMHLLDAVDGPKPLTIYVELPDQPRFLELYSRIMAQLPMDRAIPHLLNAPAPGADDLRRSARAWAHGGPTEKYLALEWLMGGRPALRELRNTTGIGERIESDGRALEVFTHVVRALAAGGVRLVVLIDEFQRVASCPSKHREGLLTSIRYVFSHNPTFFSMVLAITSRIEKSALDLLPRELQTLMGIRPTISLPEMSEEEAVEFLTGRFSYFRPRGYDADVAAPLGLDSLRLIVSEIARSGHQRLTPRTLLQVVSWVYDEAVDRGLTQVSPTMTQALLRELQWDRKAGNEEDMQISGAG